MKSQKINNRSPRPFKTKADRWSGGRDQKTFFTPAKPAVRIAKPAAAETADKKSTDSTSEGK